MLRSILVPLDLSPASDRALERALCLPLAEDARVTLLHAVPALLPTPARERAEKDAGVLLAEHAERLASALRVRADVRSVVAVGSAAASIGQQARDLDAQLILMGRGGHGALHRIVLGATAERVVRRCKIPVLVARLPAESAYSRPLLALDVDEPVHDLLEALLLVAPESPPVLDWVHAYEAPFEGFLYPSFTEDEARQYRNHYFQRAHHEISIRIDAATKHAGIAPGTLSFRSHVTSGPPRTVVAETVLRVGADLLVLGTHAYSAATRAILGTVAGDVLREVPCDVLVVPRRGDGSDVGAA